MRNAAVACPLFSIVTVTLNCADTATRTARSVLAQDFAEYQYIVKDGGSTDGTIERLSDMGISPCVKEDSGIYDAMNQGLRLCRGRFVCFLNAGDCFASPHALSRVCRAIQSRPSARLLYGDVVVQDVPRLVRYPERLSPFFLYRKQLCHQACFTERSALTKAGAFDTTFALMADYDLLLRLVLIERIQCLHVRSTVVNYDNAGASSARSNVKRLLHERSRILRRHFSRPKRALYETLTLLSGRPIRRWLSDNPHSFYLIKWVLARTHSHARS